jgi:hypothetical protein
MEGTHSTERIEPNTQQPIKKKKKKGVTRVAHAATLQLNPAMEGYSQYEKGNQQPILKQKGVTWVIQATTSQRNPGCTEKRILVQDQDGGNAQHGKDRTQHHKHLQKGLSERRGPRGASGYNKVCYRAIKRLRRNGPQERRSRRTERVVGPWEW